MDHVCRASSYKQDKHYDARNNVMHMEAPYCVCEICGRRFNPFAATEEKKDEIRTDKKELPGNGI